MEGPKTSLAWHPTLHYGLLMGFGLSELLLSDFVALSPLGFLRAIFIGEGGRS